MKVVVEKVPVKHPRPFQPGDIIKSNDGEYYYLLLENAGKENQWRYVCLSPTQRNGQLYTGLTVGDTFDPKSYSLYPGVITLSNEG